MALPILDGLDKWGVIIGEVVILHIIVILSLLDLQVILLIKPCELNASFVKELNNIGTNAACQDSHTPDTNTVPTTILTKLMILSTRAKLNKQGRPLPPE